MKEFSDTSGELQNPSMISTENKFSIFMNNSNLAFDPNIFLSTKLTKIIFYVDTRIKHIHLRRKFCILMVCDCIKLSQVWFWLIVY